MDPTQKEFPGSWTTLVKDAVKKLPGYIEDTPDLLRKFEELNDTQNLSAGAIQLTYRVLKLMILLMKEWKHSRKLYMT